MSQKSQQLLSTELGSITRIHSFDRVESGMTLATINGLTNQVERLGVVAAVDRETVGNNHERTSVVTLDNGQRMTRRGWQTRRLWKLA